MQCCAEGSRQHYIEKILFNVVLILLRKSWREEISVQCYPRGCRQHSIRKNPVECYLNTLGTMLHRSNLFEMLSEKLVTILLQNKKKSCLMLFNNLGAALNR